MSHRRVSPRVRASKMENYLLRSLLAKPEQGKLEREPRNSIPNTRKYDPELVRVRNVFETRILGLDFSQLKINKRTHTTTMNGNRSPERTGAAGDRLTVCYSRYL